MAAPHPRGGQVSGLEASASLGPGRARAAARLRATIVQHGPDLPHQTSHIRPSTPFGRALLERMLAGRPIRRRSGSPPDGLAAPGERAGTPACLHSLGQLARAGWRSPASAPASAARDGIPSLRYALPRWSSTVLTV